ncbi:MAG: hypothetical protein LBC82_07310 [Oscillospiraceae bacterium]|nr:hypothetical protein [Oscillospiraceae bacterium]
MFAATSCPGPFIKSRLQAICDEVNKRLGAAATPAPIPTPATARVGNIVTINSGARYGGLGSARGTTVPPLQLAPTRHTVVAVQTNGGVVEARLNEINSWVPVSFLTVVGGNASPTPTPTPAPSPTGIIAVNSRVTINNGARYGGLSTARGAVVPAAQFAPRVHTVSHIQTNNGVREALLREISSWVAVASLTLV